MEHVLSLEETHGVPLKVDVGVGKNWGEMEKQ
jgi:DNA polymerase I-like protein with 3'-5' exonuclease and polymerase domains